MRPFLKLMSRTTKHLTDRKPARTRRRLLLETFEDRTVPSISIGDASAVEGDASLRFIDNFVSAEPSGLDGPRHLAFGPDGNLYVPSRWSNQILKYNGTTGTFLGVFVEGGPELHTPWAMTFGPDGHLYVGGADTTNVTTNHIFRYDGATGAPLPSPGQSGAIYVPAGLGGLIQPKGITFGPHDGDLYVCAITPVSIGNKDEVLRYQGPIQGTGDPTPGTPLPAAGQSGAVFIPDGSGGTNAIDGAKGAAFGPDSTGDGIPELYVSNGGGDSVNRYNGATGAFIDVFVSSGSGGMDLPDFLTFRADYLYVSSQETEQVMRYSGTTGAFVDVVVPTVGGVFATTGLAFDASNNLYVAAGAAGADSRVVRYGPASQAAFTVTLSEPSASTVSVNYLTGGGTATSGADYTGTSGTVTFAPGQTSRTILVQTLDDTAGEPTETFNVNLGDPVGATITDGQGVGTILDNETKFFVVNDAATNQTYEYAGGGNSVESYNLDAGNTAPRGAASTAAGNKVWVVDANKTVYVYDPSGSLLGSWTAGGLNGGAQVEGIATDGTDIWILDAKQDQVLRYAGAATRLSGSQSSADRLSLNSQNRDPKGIVNNGASLWVVNDSSTDKVFRYGRSGLLMGSWTMTGGGGSPTGITLDPANVDHLWVVDAATDRVYQYDNAASRTSGSQAASVSFALAAGNTNPQDIADPPTAALVAEPMPVPSPARVADEHVAAGPSWGTSLLDDAFGPPVAARFPADEPATDEWSRPTPWGQVPESMEFPSETPPMTWSDGLVSIEGLSAEPPTWRKR